MFIYVTRIYVETCERRLLLKITGWFFFLLDRYEPGRRYSQFLLHLIKVTAIAIVSPDPVKPPRQAAQYETLAEGWAGVYRSSRKRNTLYNKSIYMLCRYLLFIYV
jgi:hypothetical protein